MVKEFEKVVEFFSVASLIVWLKGREFNPFSGSWMEQFIRDQIGQAWIYRQGFTYFIRTSNDEFRMEIPSWFDSLSERAWRAARFMDYSMEKCLQGEQKMSGEHYIKLLENPEWFTFQHGQSQPGFVSPGYTVLPEGEF